MVSRRGTGSPWRLPGVAGDPCADEMPTDEALAEVDAAFADQQVAETDAVLADRELADGDDAWSGEWSGDPGLAGERLDVVDLTDQVDGLLHS